MKTTKPKITQTQPERSPEIDWNLMETFEGDSAQDDQDLILSLAALKSRKETRAEIEAEDMAMVKIYHASNSLLDKRSIRAIGTMTEGLQVTVTTLSSKPISQLLR